MDADAPTRGTGLLLDIGGVVLLPSPVLIDRLAEREPRLARALGGRGRVGGPDDELWQRMLRHEVSERAYWAERARDISAALGIEGGSTRELMDLLYDGPADDWLCHPVIDLVTDARAARIPVGALTNDMAAFHGPGWVERQTWLQLFDVVVDASRTGILKPDPRAYAAGVGALGLDPGDVVYLDDMPWNVAGGVAAGLQSIQVSHADPLPAVAEARRRLALSPVAA